MLKKGFWFNLYLLMGLEVVLLLLFVFFEGPLYLIFLPFILFVILVSIGSANINSQFFIKSYCEGELKQGIGITFDDGPDSTVTPKVLEILDQYNAKATFFVIGEKAKKHPELIKEMSIKGHLIGNHSYAHSNNFPVLNLKKLKEEIVKTNEVLIEILGKKIRWFRPPFGVLNPNIAQAVSSVKMDVIGWTIRSFDTKKQTVEKISKRVIEQIEPGKIILFHDRLESTCQVLVNTLEHCKNTGIKIVSLEELIDRKAYD